MDRGGGGADAAGGEQGLETDIGDARIHAGGGAAGRDRSINCYGEGYENKDHICKLRSTCLELGMDYWRVYLER